jgi:hypothetical protein
MFRQYCFISKIALYYIRQGNISPTDEVTKMRYSQELREVKSSLLDKVAVAAQQRDLDAVAYWSQTAKQCETLELQAEEVERQIAKFKEVLRENVVSDYSKRSNGVDVTKKNRTISPKREGKEVRNEWVEEIKSKGIRLVGHGKRYQTTRGDTVGIAFANELEGKEDRWFLGLRDEPTDVAVLLCKDRSGLLHDLILPVEELSTYWHWLSKSKGQIKFNVRRDGSDFWLLVPGIDPVTVTHYRANYRPLQ